MTSPDGSEHFHEALQPLLLDAFEQLSTACFVTAADGRIAWANKAFSVLTGYARDELRGHTPALFNSGTEGPAFYAELWQQILSGRTWRGTVVDKRKDGGLYLAEEIITPLRSADGSITHFVAVQHPLGEESDRRNVHGLSARQSGLLSLPSRADFVMRLDSPISMASRTAKLLGVLRLAVSDTRGQAADIDDEHRSELMTALWQRLQASVRRSDCSVQLGAGEFAVMLADLAAQDDAVRIAGKLQHALALPYLLRTRQTTPVISMGIALFPRDAGGAEGLLARAGHALYQASLQGGNRVQFYEHSFEHRVADHLPAGQAMQ